MQFFDDKEEVLDVQLTQYGKYKLSIGKWKPVYYAFFDDNILYDGEYGQISENQNDIETRIQEETPRMKTQHTFTGRETDFLRIREDKQKQEDDLKDAGRRMREEDKIKIQSDPEKYYHLTSRLGTSNYGDPSGPAFSIKILNGDLTSTAEKLVGDYGTLDIPQIDLDLTYRYYIGSDFDESYNSSINQPEIIFPDGTYLVPEKREVLVEIEELNTPFEVENFDIEVFEMTGSTRQESLNQLYFIKDDPQIVDDILISDEYREQANFVMNPSYVEYFFNVDVDYEIDPQVIYESVQNLKSKGIYVDSDFNEMREQFAETPVRQIYNDPETSEEMIVCADDDAALPPRAKATRRKE